MVMALGCLETCGKREREGGRLEERERRRRERGEGSADKPVGTLLSGGGRKKRRRGRGEDGSGKQKKRG